MAALVLFSFYFAISVSCFLLGFHVQLAAVGLRLMFGFAVRCMRLAALPLSTVARSNNDLEYSLTTRRFCAISASIVFSVAVGLVRRDSLTGPVRSVVCFGRTGSWERHCPNGRLFSSEILLQDVVLAGCVLVTNDVSNEQICLSLFSPNFLQILGSLSAHRCEIILIGGFREKIS